MNAFFEDVYNKEAEVLLMYYENEDQNIVDSFFIETADSTKSEKKIDFKKIGESIQNKIKEIIKKIKDFFIEVKRKHDVKKFLKLLNSPSMRTKEVASMKINDKKVVATLNAIVKENERALAETKKLYSDCKKGKITKEEFATKSNDIYADLVAKVDKMQKETSNLVIKSNDKSDLISFNNVSERLSTVLDQYDKSLNKIYNDCLGVENMIQQSATKVDEDQGKNQASVSAAANTSKISRKCAIALGATGAILTGVSIFLGMRHQKIDTVNKVANALDKQNEVERANMAGAISYGYQENIKDIYLKKNNEYHDATKAQIQKARDAAINQIKHPIKTRAPKNGKVVKSN